MTEMATLLSAVALWCGDPSHGARPFECRKRLLECLSLSKGVAALYMNNTQGVVKCFTKENDR